MASGERAGGDAEIAVSAGAGSSSWELRQMEFESRGSSGDQVAMTTGGASVLVATPIGNLGDLSPRTVSLRTYSKTLHR